MPLFRLADTSTRNYRSHSLGSVLALVDSAGTVQQGYAYDVFGAVTEQSGSLGSEPQFAGQQSDPDGLQYLRARFYDPATGRFLSRDSWSVSDKTVFHPYVYARNNPATMTDPSGHCGPTTTPNVDADCPGLGPGNVPVGPDGYQGPPQAAITDADAAGESGVERLGTINSGGTPPPSQPPTSTEPSGDAGGGAAQVFAELNAIQAQTGATVAARLDLGGESFIGTNPARGNAPIPGTFSFFVQHAEGDAFAQAIGAGNYAGQSGTPYVTQAPCGFCTSSISATARMMGLSSLTIVTPDGVWGTYTPDTGLVRVR